MTVTVSNKSVNMPELKILLANPEKAKQSLLTLASDQTCDVLGETAPEQLLLWMIQSWGDDFMKKWGDTPIASIAPQNVWKNLTVNQSNLQTLQDISYDGIILYEDEVSEVINKVNNHGLSIMTAKNSKGDVDMFSDEEIDTKLYYLGFDKLSISTCIGKDKSFDHLGRMKDDTVEIKFVSNDDRAVLRQLELLGLIKDLNFERVNLQNNLYANVTYKLVFNSIEDTLRDWKFWTDKNVQENTNVVETRLQTLRERAKEWLTKGYLDTLNNKILKYIKDDTIVDDTDYIKSIQKILGISETGSWDEKGIDTFDTYIVDYICKLGDKNIDGFNMHLLYLEQTSRRQDDMIQRLKEEIRLFKDIKDEKPYLQNKLMSDEELSLILLGLGYDKEFFDFVMSLDKKIKDDARKPYDLIQIPSVSTIDYEYLKELESLRVIWGLHEFKASSGSNDVRFYLNGSSVIDGLKIRAKNGLLQSNKINKSPNEKEIHETINVDDVVVIQYLERNGYDKSVLNNIKTIDAFYKEKEYYSGDEVIRKYHKDMSKLFFDLSKLGCISNVHQLGFDMKFTIDEINPYDYIIGLARSNTDPGSARVNVGNKNRSRRAIHKQPFKNQENILLPKIDSDFQQNKHTSDPEKGYFSTLFEGIGNLFKPHVKIENDIIGKSDKNEKNNTTRMSSDKELYDPNNAPKSTTKNSINTDDPVGFNSTGESAIKNFSKRLLKAIGSGLKKPVIVGGATFAAAAAASWVWPGAALAVTPYLTTAALGIGAATIPYALWKWYKPQSKIRGLDRLYRNTWGEAIISRKKNNQG